MKICRFKLDREVPRPGLIISPAETECFDLMAAGIGSLEVLLEMENPHGFLKSLTIGHLPRYALSTVTLLPPVERQEVWAAGVTYLRSKAARMEESQFSATAYDRVYDAERPELFFKSLAEKAVGPGEPV